MVESVGVPAESEKNRTTRVRYSPQLGLLCPSEHELAVRELAALADVLGEGFRFAVAWDQLGPDDARTRRRAARVLYEVRRFVAATMPGATPLPRWSMAIVRELAAAEREARAHDEAVERWRAQRGVPLPARAPRLDVLTRDQNGSRRSRLVADAE